MFIKSKSTVICEMLKLWFMCFCIKYLKILIPVCLNIIKRNSVCLVSGERSICQSVKLADQKDRCFNLIYICR